jgi:hypothetical protein
MIIAVNLLLLKNAYNKYLFLMMIFFWILAPCRLIFHIQPWIRKQYVSPKRWHLLTSLHGAKTQNNIIILTAVITSNLTCNIYVIIWFTKSLFGLYKFPSHARDNSLKSSRSYIFYFGLFGVWDVQWKKRVPTGKYSRVLNSRNYKGNIL